jgi:1-deoxy-D-xylulose-5-phosphate synthase
LGAIELTIALHYVFNTPDDLLVWDVGHQAYGKILLVAEIISILTDSNGISGFPKISESEYDTFGVGLLS